jgi:hypothetical protein
MALVIDAAEGLAATGARAPAARVGRPLLFFGTERSSIFSNECLSAANAVR